MEQTVFDFLAVTAAVVRLALFVVFAFVAVWCIHQGTTIFAASARAFAHESANVEDQAELSFGIKEQRIIVRGASGLGLIALAVLLAIVLIRTEFRFEYDIQSEGRRLQSSLSDVIGLKTAKAQDDRWVYERAEFCKFVRDSGKSLKVIVKSADGGVLSEERKRILAHLNELEIVGSSDTLSPAQTSGLSDDFHLDNNLRRYVRYLIVEGSIPVDRLNPFCRNPSRSIGSLSSEIDTLLSVRLNP